MEDATMTSTTSEENAAMGGVNRWGFIVVGRLVACSAAVNRDRGWIAGASPPALNEPLMN